MFPLSIYLSTPQRKIDEGVERLGCRSTVDREAVAS